MRLLMHDKPIDIEKKIKSFWELLFFTGRGVCLSVIVGRQFFLAPPPVLHAAKNYGPPVDLSEKTVLPFGF